MSQRLRSLLAILLLALLAPIANAACPVSLPSGTDCVNAAATKAITAHSSCRSVTNNHVSSQAIMIPVNTSTEWTRFYSNLPGGVTASTCTMSVTSVSPQAGLAVGATTITVTGTGFVSGAVVRVNGTNCSTSTFVSATQMTCDVPSAAAGTIASVDVSVVNPDTSSASLASGFYYVGAPRTWLRADAGVSVGSGNDVLNWADSSGTGNHASTSGPYPQRVLASANFNNKPVITFSGANLLEFTRLNTFQNVAGASAVVALRPTSTGNNQAIFSYWTGADGNDRFGFAINAVTGNTNRGTSPTGNFYLLATRVDGTGHEYIRGGTLTVNSPVIMAGSMNYSAQTAELAINGSVVSTGSNMLTSGSTSDTASLNGNFGAADTYNYFSGDVAEIFHFGIAITSAERQVLENYLKAKYNLP